MRTLKEHTLIYDDECPLCDLYSAAFVKSGMVDEQGRQPYTEAVKCQLPQVDWQRACNEIALINRRDNTIQYGVEGIATILANNSAVIRWLFSFKVIRMLAAKLYFFISYNRKVIVPGKKFEGHNTCTPTLSYRYRTAYIIWAWLITSAILVYYSSLLTPYLPPTDLTREFLVCGGQIIFQALAVGVIQKQKVIHYLGNMMTISLAGALLLIPPILLSGIIDEKMFYVGWFFAVVGLMFLEHIRRVKILGLPWLLSGTWVLYRIFVLMVIL